MFFTVLIGMAGLLLALTVLAVLSAVVIGKRTSEIICQYAGDDGLREHLSRT